MIGIVDAREQQHWIILAAILLLSLFLNFWNLWNEGFSNEYYAAAVRSMLENPGIAFYNSFDAAGFVTIDKPPVGLWIQAVSAAIFGFSPWSVALPQVLAGVCSVGLLYLLVSRAFGKPAGLVAAFALAVTPIFVAVSRNGTMDGQLIFVILLAVFVALKAAQERSLPYLLLSVILIGIGFNIKMVQAFVVFPAILVVYTLGAGIPVRQKAFHLAAAILVLLIVSLSWAVVVDLTPPGQRPYIGNSGDNTVFSLILNYNGIHRLENSGAMAGNGAGPKSRSDQAWLQNGSGMQPPARPGSGDPDGWARNASQGLGSGPAGIRPPDQRSMMRNSTIAGNATPWPGFLSGRMPGGDAPMGSEGEMGTGTPGLFRLFGSDLAGQLSWLLPFALLGLLVWSRRPASLSVQGLVETGICGVKGLTLIAMVLWLVPGLLYFTFTTGFWHPYYLATIAPPLAALTGIGAVGMYEAYIRDGWRGWLLAGAVAVTGVWETIILTYTAEWSGILIPITLTGCLGGAGALAYIRLRTTDTAGLIKKGVAICAVAILFVSPFVWACTPLMHGESGILPSAGPRNGVGSGIPQGGFTNSGGGRSDVSGIAPYLISHNTGETYLVAVPSSMGGGASLIIETGKPVMALGGFGGNDQIVTIDQLPGLIGNHTVRYFLAQGTSGNRGTEGARGIGGDAGTSGGMSGLGGNSAIWAWVKGHCSAVQASDLGGSNTRQMRQGILYDCAGAV